MITKIFKDSYNFVIVLNPNLASPNNWFEITKVKRDYIGFVYSYVSAVELASN